MTEKPKHWYCLSFVGSDERGNTIYGSVQTGYESQLVTLERIRLAKLDAGVNRDSVLIAATYLGRGTRSEILSGYNPA